MMTMTSINFYLVQYNICPEGRIHTPDLISNVSTVGGTGDQSATVVHKQGCKACSNPDLVRV